MPVAHAACAPLCPALPSAPSPPTPPPALPQLAREEQAAYGRLDAARRERHEVQRQAAELRKEVGEMQAALDGARKVLPGLREEQARSMRSLGAAREVRRGLGLGETSSDHCSIRFTFAPPPRRV